MNQPAIDGPKRGDTPMFPLEPLQLTVNLSHVKRCEGLGPYHKRVKVCLLTVHKFTLV